MASGPPGEPGYIGSRACLDLLNESKSRRLRTSPEDIQHICRKLLTVIDGDIGDQTMIEKNGFECTAVIYLVVFDSGKSPLYDYDNNVVGAHRLMWPRCVKGAYW
jgi:UDP-glucose 4-epimerase